MQTEEMIGAVIANLPAGKDKLDEYRKEQKEDVICSTIMKYCESGLPRWKSKLHPVLIPHWEHKAMFTVEKELLLYNSCTVVPTSIQNHVLEKIHPGHQGIKFDSNTATKQVVQAQKKWFLRHGIPENLNSDNGPQFSSQVFADFSQSYGFKHNTSSPHFPLSNGLAERNIQTVKMFEMSKDSFMALVTYQSTPLLWCQHSPAESLMG
uniref:Integrase catalytic domain-containing protein n=1 Tax=Amphimedon queenslandica TaxID=400682 RepID=A0A1X7VX55_AMPQE